MDPLSSFFTLANVYDPQKAQTNRMALDFGRQELEAGKLRNRVDTMALEQKVGGDALSLQAGRNALAQLIQNAQPAAGTVQNAAAQPGQAQPQQAPPQVQNAAYTPQGKPPTDQGNDYDMSGYVAKYGTPDQSKGQHLTDEFKLPNHITFSAESKYSKPGQEGGQWKKEQDGTWTFYASPFNVAQHGPDRLKEYFAKREKGNRLVLPDAQSQQQGDMIEIPGVGKVSKAYIQSNPQAYDAAARAASSYQQQQGQLAAQQLSTTADELQKQVMSALKDNDQTKLDNVKSMVNGNPALQSLFRQNGMWSTVQSLKLGMGNTPHEAVIYMDADQIKRAAAVQGSPVTPSSAPGYYSVKYVSPQGSDIFAADTKIKEAKRANLTDIELQDRAADGDKEAQRYLKNRVESKTETKSKTPEQLRAVFTDPAKSKEERDKAWNDFKLSPLSTNQLMAISTDKTLSADQRKWAQDIIKKEDERAAQKTKVAVSIRDQGRGTGAADDFSKWDKETKEWWFNTKKDTGEKPDFGWGKSAAKSRAEFAKQYAQWAQGKGIGGAEAASDKEDFKAKASALRDLTKREQIIGTFTNRIDATSKVVLDIAKKYRNSNSRLLNIPINKLKGLIGSGELQSLRLAMKSLSNEVAKVESGSLGIAEVSQGQAEYMHKVHDENLSLADMEKIAATGKELGRTSMESIAKQRNELKAGMKSSGNGDKPEPSNRISVASRRIKSDMRGSWNDGNRQQAIYKNLRKQGYSDAEIGQAYSQARGGN